MLNSERIFKIKVNQVEQFSEFCLRQQLFAFKEFYMETRQYNIFKTTNFPNFTKAILKSSYRALKVLFKQKTLKQPVYLLKAFEFCSTFDIQIDITLAIFRKKLQNHTFQKAHRSRNGQPNMLFLNFSLSSFSKLQMTVVKNLIMDFEYSQEVLLRQKYF